MKRYKLLLIKPKQQYKHYAIQEELALMLGKKTANTALALPLIAALTPDHYDITIIDEEIERVSLDIDTDLVGISSSTLTIERGYEIADAFRKKGIPVVFGGPYASYNFDEVIKHADSIVIGEAENIWAKTLSDFENNSLQKRYESLEKPEFKTSPLPRWDLIDTSKILTLTVQASRGCPFMCEFCITSELFGKKMRFRETDDVIKEIKALPWNNFFFADDNLTINKAYAMELMGKMKGLNTTWICQSSIEVADDPKLLKAMHEAGCRFILIGFESLNAESIQETQKLQNKKVNYKKQIKAIHDAGIYVYGSFIVGFDNDTLDEFTNIHNFINETNIPVFMLSMLGATPGSKLYDRLQKEGRWYGVNPTYSGGIFPVMHYNNFSQTELFINFVAMLRKVYSFKEMYERTLQLYETGTFATEKVNSEVGFLMKLKTSFLLLKRFRFSSNEYKRKMFKDFFKLSKEKKLALTEAISIMLMLESINVAIEKMWINREHYLDIIKKNDRGSWKEIKKSEQCLTESNI